MSGIRSTVTTWFGRRLQDHVQRRLRRGNVDLTKLPFVPDVLMMPLQRDGLDPVPGLAEIREREPITRLAHLFGMNIWVVTGHEATRQILANTSDFSNDIRPYVGGSQESTDRYIGGLGFTDPPEHTRLRKILTPEFTMRRLERLKPQVEQIVERQLDEMEANGPVVDLVEHFAAPIPFLVISELLGLPDDDRASFQKLGHARFDVSQGGIGSLGAVSESRTFLLEAVKRQREHPGDGLIGKIITDYGDEIDDVDLSGIADGVFTGGFETSASMLALGAMVLLQHPDDLDWLRRDDAAIEPVVEELLRYLSVVQISFPRFARADMELFGSTVKAGDVVVCSLSGANRDAASPGNAHTTAMPDDAFHRALQRDRRTSATGLAEPTTARGVNTLEWFDPQRPAAPHYAFGHGFHRCLGAELGRIELRAAYPALMRRFPELSLATDPADLNFRRLSIVYGVESLPVRLR